MKRLQLLALAMVVLLAACGDGGAEPIPTPSATTASPTAGPTATVTASPSGQPAATPTRTSGPSGYPASCAAVTGGSEGTDVKLVAVRVGSHAGSDRITFEFGPPKAPSPPNALPKYTVNKVDQVTQDGSGNPVQIGGQAQYSLVMQGASGVDLSGPQPVITYNGPREFKPNFPALVELEHAGDFENVLSWGIGVKGPRCIQASQLNSPLRLVLDIPHQ